MSVVYVDEEPVSDEDYLISQAKRCLRNDPSAAKSWIITAKSLFPKNFNIQYEAYQMACGSGDVKEAAQFFDEMMKAFRNEGTLWAEMQKMADALRVETKTDDMTFLRDLFSQLSVDVQHEMLLSVADHCEDTMEHCRLLLLLLQKFPSRSYQHGAKLIDTLFAAEKHRRSSLPVNEYRKLLVCDVLPLILTTQNFVIPPKLMFRLLSKAIEFYVSYVTSPGSKELEYSSRCDDPFKLDDPIAGPWLQLFELMEIAGKKLNWELSDIFSSDGHFTLSELNWQRILTVLHKKSTFSEPADMSLSAGGTGEDMTSHIKEVFFCATVIYFYSLCQFGKQVYPEWFSGSSLIDTHYVLIEGIQALPQKEEIDLSIKSKKRKMDGERDSDLVPQLIVSRTASSETASVLTQSFVTGIKCWELLHNSHHTIKKEFNRLAQHLRMEEWPWYQEFFIGTIIYQGFHQDAISKLFHTQNISADEFIKNKTSLQLASCLYYIGDYSRACKSLFDVICSFPQTVETPSSHMEPLQKRSGHHLHFIAFKQRETLQYCVKLLITIFKEKALQTPLKDSMLLGHLIVLLQYDWPQEECLFLQCVEAIKKQGNFCYGLFFNYVINPDILEEFMYLTTTAGGAVSLDLLPTSTVQIGKQRAVTRGVNKGAKEDLKGNMEKQMSRCDEDLDNLLISFIKQEKDLLLQNFM